MEVLSDADDSSNTGRLPAHYIDSCCESISSFLPVFPSQQTVLSACAQLHLGIRIREADRIEVPILDRWVTSDVTMEFWICLVWSILKSHLDNQGSIIRKIRGVVSEAVSTYLPNWVIRERKCREVFCTSRIRILVSLRSLPNQTIIVNAAKAKFILTPDHRSIRRSHISLNNINHIPNLDNRPTDRNSKRWEICTNAEEESETICVV